MLMSQEDMEAISEGFGCIVLWKPHARRSIWMELSCKTTNAM